MNGLAADEMVVFSARCPPRNTRAAPPMAGFPRDKRRLEATSGRKRLNIQGALDLETFQFTFVEGEEDQCPDNQTDAAKLERNNQTMTTIHVFVDNARYPSCQDTSAMLDSPERRVKIAFLASICPAS